MRFKTWNDQAVLTGGLKAHEETLTALDKANKSRIYKKKHPDSTNWKMRRVMFLMQWWHFEYTRVLVCLKSPA